MRFLNSILKRRKNSGSRPTISASSTALSKSLITPMVATKRGLMPSPTSCRITSKSMRSATHTLISRVCAMTSRAEASTPLSVPVGRPTTHLWVTSWNRILPPVVAQTTVNTRVKNSMPSWLKHSRQKAPKKLPSSTRKHRRSSLKTFQQSQCGTPTQQLDTPKLSKTWNSRGIGFRSSTPSPSLKKKLMSVTKHSDRLH